MCQVTLLPIEARNTMQSVAQLLCSLIQPRFISPAQLAKAAFLGGQGVVRRQNGCC